MDPLTARYVPLVMTLMLAVGVRATDKDDAMTATCCWPLQFQARLGRHLGTPAGGSPGMYEEEMLLYFDFAYKRWGFWMRENFVTNDYMELIYLEDYMTHKATIGTIKGCYRIPLPPDARMRHPCLPADAKYIETGWLGEKELPYDVWQWEVPEEDFDSRGEPSSATVTVALSHDYCRPISEISMWTAQNFNYTAHIEFLTMHLGETDGINDDPYEDLKRFYDCKDVDKVPADFDILWDAHADQIHLLNRLHTPASTPPEEPPIIG